MLFYVYYPGRFEESCIILTEVKFAIIFYIGHARDLFRTTGGLSYVRDVLYSTSDSRMKQASMYTLGCAIEKNGMFSIL